MRTLGQWLRDHRKRQKPRWTQGDLAGRLSVATSTVSRWERDQGEPSLSEFRECCLLFRASADAALGTGLGEIDFAASSGIPEERSDGDEEERTTESGRGREGAAPVRGEADGAGASGARRRDGR